jgi:hypoxia up-regulated 1
MKSMQRPYKSKRPTTKPKKKPKKTSTKKAKGSKTGSAEKAEQTLDFTDDGMPSFKIGEDGEMPSEEEIMAWIEKEKAKQAAADSKAQKDVPDEEPKTEQTEETDGDNGNKHDEL